MNFCYKVASDTISKYNQLKQENDDNYFNQIITKIQVDVMFTTVLREFKEVNEKTNSAVDEILMKNKKTIVQFIIAVLLESKVVENEEEARLEMH